jgi:hypothetical protein
MHKLNSMQVNRAEMLLKSLLDQDDLKGTAYEVIFLRDENSRLEQENDGLKQLRDSNGWDAFIKATQK